MRTKRLVALLVAIVMSIGLVAVASVAQAPAAVAYTSSAGGSGSGGSGGSGHFTGWKAWFGEDAYKGFKSWAHADDDDVRRVADGISVSTCKKSYAVWAVYGNMSWKSLDKYNKTNTVATIPTSSPKGNDFKEAGKKAKMPSYIINKTYDKYDTKDNVWLVCAEHDDSQTQTAKSDTPGTRVIDLDMSKTKTETSESDDTYMRSGLYSTNTAIAPYFKGNPSTTNWEGQAGDEAITNYGQVAILVNNAIANNLFITADELKKMVDDALAADKEVGDQEPTLMSLSQKNLDGLAEGGVLNIFEYGRNVYVKAITKHITTKVIAEADMVSEVQDTNTHCEWKQKRDFNWKKWDWGAWYDITAKTCSTTDVGSGTKQNIPAGTVISSSTEDKMTNDVVDGPLTIDAFWQILSVHCNKEGFDKLMTAVPSATVVDSGDDSRQISAVAYSKKYDNLPVSPDFGNPMTGNKDKAASGTVGFYNKECPYDCKATSSDDNATVDNGASTNIGDVGKKSDTSWGATDASGGLNSNVFQFFRDNLARDITVDTWFPQSNSIVSYDGTAPITTTITRWTQGTPSIAEGLASVAAKHDTTDTAPVPIFTGAAAVANTQTNWDATEQNTSTTAILPGLYRTLSVAGQWASDSNKPEIFNLKWEYGPLVTSRVPATNIGFDENNNQVVGDLEEVVAPIQGKCYAQFGTTDEIDTSSLFQKFTGSGTVNDLDGDALGSTPIDDHSSLIVKFVRATTE